MRAVESTWGRAGAVAPGIRAALGIWAALGLVAGPAAATIGPDETDPRKIVEAVDARTEGDRVKGTLTMTITDKAGRQRQRVVQSRSLKFDGGTRNLMVFTSPPDESGTGLLSIDYDDGNKDDDQWLWLPSLKKSTRISSGDKAGSFMGTDFSFSDMTKADPEHYDYTLIKPSVKVDGEDCWLIEARPRTDKARRETGYLKTQTWISKEKLLPLRAKSWIKEGKRLKFITFKDIRKVNGLWTAHTLTASTRRGKETESTTVLQFSALSFDNEDVTEALFGERQLEKGL